MFFLLLVLLFTKHLPFSYTTLFRSTRLQGDVERDQVRWNTVRGHDPGERAFAGNEPLGSTASEVGKSRAVAQQEEVPGRSKEHTSELQSRLHHVCRRTLEKKYTNRN